MAYLYNNALFDDEEEKNRPPTSPDGGMVGSSSISPLSGGSQSSTNRGFTGLMTYLNANRDQSMDLSNKVASKVREAGEFAKQGINDFTNQYNQKIASSSITPDSELVSRANQNPSEFVKNQDDVNKFKSMRDASFNDPGIFEEQEGYGDIFKKVQDASNYQKLATSDAGRYQILNQMNPNLGVGKTRLNNLLLSGNPESRQNLENAASPYSGLMDYLNQQSQESAKNKKAAIDNTNSAKDLVKTNFINPQQSYVDQLQNDLRDRQSSVYGEDQVKNKAIQDLINAIENNNPYAITPEESSMFFGSPTLPVNKSYYMEQAKKLLPAAANASGYDDVFAWDTLKQAAGDPYVYPKIDSNPNVLLSKLPPIMANWMSTGVGNYNDLIRQYIDNYQPSSPLYKGTVSQLKDLLSKSTALPTELPSDRFGVSEGFIPTTNNYLGTSPVPIEKTPSDWLTRYFPGTQISYGDGGENTALQNLLTSDEYARLAALSQLLGSDNISYFDANKSYSPYTGSMIGRYTG